MDFTGWVVRIVRPDRAHWWCDAASTISSGLPRQLAPNPVLPAEVLGFLKKHELLGPYCKFLRLAHEAFALRAEPYPELVCEPEDPMDEWVALCVPVRGNISEIMKQKWAFVKAVCSQVPKPAIRFLRLSLDIA